MAYLPILWGSDLAHHPGHHPIAGSRSLDPIAVPGPHRGPWTPSGSPPNGSGDIGVASVSRERGAGGCREVVSKPGRNESRRRRLSWRAVQAAHPTGHRRQPAGGSAQMRRPVGDRVRVHQPGGQACTPYAPPALGPRVQDPVPILVTGQGERPGSSAAGRRGTRALSLACDEDWNRILNAGPKGRWCVGGAGLTAGLVNADPVTDRSPHLCRSTRGLSSVTWQSPETVETPIDVI